MNTTSLSSPPKQRHDSPHSKGGSIIVWDASPLSLLATAGALHTAGNRCVCARHAAAVTQSLSWGQHDAIVIDVGDDPQSALDTLEQIRLVDGYESLPAVLIATTDWSGLERRVEMLPVATRCLFKPIDPNSLLAVVESLMWMPALQSNHRRKGSRPSRTGWVTL